MAVLELQGQKPFVGLLAFPEAFQKQVKGA